MLLALASRPALIDRHGLRGRINVQSFDWRTLALESRQARDMALAALTVRRMVKSQGARGWSPHFRGLTPQRLAEAWALGLRMIPWTVSEPAGIERLLAEGSTASSATTQIAWRVV